MNKGWEFWAGQRECTNLSTRFCQVQYSMEHHPCCCAQARVVQWTMTSGACFILSSKSLSWRQFDFQFRDSCGLDFNLIYFNYFSMLYFTSCVLDTFSWFELSFFSGPQSHGVPFFDRFQVTGKGGRTALMYRPWKCHMQRQSKWKIMKIKPHQLQTGANIIKNHMDT